MDDKWDFLLSEFRRLGGIAENVCQKEGEFGRGIFSINPNLRSKIYTPSELMINKDDITLEGILSKSFFKSKKLFKKVNFML